MIALSQNADKTLFWSAIALTVYNLALIGYAASI